MPGPPSTSERPSLSIGDLYSRVDRALREALPGEVWVSGEVRSFNVSSRGHCYLDLVDPMGAQDMGAPVLKVVCWSGRWARVRATLDQLGITLDAGLVVRVRGEVQVYKPRGDISFILSELDTDALLGKVAAERARLVKALVDEGLFDRNRAVPVPRLPLRIGLVTSPGTEGYRDFMGRLTASGMAFDVRIVATQVQGREAPASVAAAIARLQAEDCDVLVVVRGGGSKGDLATFDTELVARAIATSSVPVWTGIGHTGDQSVADEVANRAFITPTECGQELARLAGEYWESAIVAGRTIARTTRERLAEAEHVIDRGRRGVATGARAQVDRHADRLVHRAHAVRGAVQHQTDIHAHRLATGGAAVAKAAVRALDDGEHSLARQAVALAGLPARRLGVEELRAAQWRRLLGAFDYQRQLERGYSVTRDASGSVVRSVAGATPGSTLFTQLSDGEVSSVVDGGSGTGTRRPVGDDEARHHDEDAGDDEGHEEGTR